VDAAAGGPTHLVAAGILIRDGRVLLCHRCADRSWYPDVWDFPGGHVEAGETSALALVRELREELGIATEVPSAPAFDRLVTSDFDCTLWIVTEWIGTPTLLSPLEHDELAWCSLRMLNGLRLADESYATLIARALDGANP
jgi:mutator protein MutT